MSMPKKYVVIPTYKEGQNLRRLLPLLKNYSVIIVDDDSKDGTGKICKKFRNVKLITRKNKRGMASASLEGFLSIAEKDAYVVFMDADFEHDPAKLPSFFKALDEADIVVGVKTGKRERIRGIVSEIGKRAAYVMLPDTKVLDDPMSCFFGVKKSSLDASKLKDLTVEPYGKLMLAMLSAVKAGSKLHQINYKYGARKAGSSKISRFYFVDYLKEITHLNGNRLFLFLLIGAIGVPLNEGLAALFYGRMALSLDLLLAITISTVVNFLANNYITFRSRSHVLPAFIKFMAISFIITAITNFVVAVALSYFIFYLLANLFGIIAAFIVKYGLSETYIWKPKSGAYLVYEGR